MKKTLAWLLMAVALFSPLDPLRRVTAAGLNVGADVMPSNTLATGNTFDVPLVNPSGNSMRLVIDITAISGGCTLTITIQAKDRLSGKLTTILASTALAAVATTELKVGPGLPASANVSANDIVPHDINIHGVTAVGGQVTFSIRAEFTD